MKTVNAAMRDPAPFYDNTHVLLFGVIPKPHFLINLIRFAYGDGGIISR